MTAKKSRISTDSKSILVPEMDVISELISDDEVY